jgi:tRNA G10  N-methylase Trm11
MSESQDTAEQSPVRENGSHSAQAQNSKALPKQDKLDHLEIAPFELVDKVKQKKMAEDEVRAIANRINHLELEEQRARKRIEETKKRTQLMIEAKKRNEEAKREKLKFQDKLKKQEEDRREKFNKDRLMRKNTIEKSKNSVEVKNKLIRNVTQVEKNSYKE